MISNIAEHLPSGKKGTEHQQESQRSKDTLSPKTQPNTFKAMLSNHMRNTLEHQEAEFWQEIEAIIGEEEIDDEETRKYIQGLYQQGYTPQDIKTILDRARRQSDMKEKKTLSHKEMDALRYAITTNISEDLWEKLHTTRNQNSTEQDRHLLQFATEVREKSKKEEEAEKRRAVRQKILQNILDKQLEIYEIHIDAQGNLCIKMADGSIRSIPLPEDLDDPNIQKLLQAVKRNAPEIHDHIAHKLSSLMQSSKELNSQEYIITPGDSLKKKGMGKTNQITKSLEEIAMITNQKDTTQDKHSEQISNSKNTNI